MPSPPSRLSRTAGALLGLHAGDSLGATFEFSSWDKIHAAHPHPNTMCDIVGGGPFGWTAGQATDDTDTMRAVLLAYQGRHRGEVEDVCITAAERLLDWFVGRWPGREFGSQPVDIGGATATGLQQFAMNRDIARSGAGRGQAGNGSLMRCLPTGLFQDDEELRKKESKRISAITHDDLRCVAACAAYNEIVHALIDGEEVEDAVEAGLIMATKLDGSGAVVEAIRLGKNLKIQGLAENGPAPSLPGRASGYVLESLSISVSAVLDPRSLEDILVDVVRIGKDTDTNAAIAGGLLGTRDGLDAIPEEWRKKLQFGDEFVELAKELTPE